MIYDFEKKSNITIVVANMASLEHLVNQFCQWKDTQTIQTANGNGNGNGVGGSTIFVG